MGTGCVGAQQQQQTVCASMSPQASMRFFWYCSAPHLRLARRALHAAGWQVYLVRTDAEGAFTAMAVVGTSATELEVKSTLSREQFKQLLQRAARQAAQ